MTLKPGMTFKELQKAEELEKAKILSFKSGKQLADLPSDPTPKVSGIAKPQDGAPHAIVPGTSEHMLNAMTPPKKLKAPKIPASINKPKVKQTMKKSESLIQKVKEVLKNHNK